MEKNKTETMRLNTHRQNLTKTAQTRNVICITLAVLVCVSIVFTHNQPINHKGALKVNWATAAMDNMQEGEEFLNPESNTSFTHSISQQGTLNAQNANSEIVGDATSNWDLNKVNIAYDTEGVPVPVPKGYVASNADGEHTVNTGFVIYEGNEEVTTANAWEQSTQRNQWVWVPVPDPSRIYETDSNGKKKAKLYTYNSSNSSGRTTYTNSNYEPGILKNVDDERHFVRYTNQLLTEDELLEDLQEEFENCMTSIEKYGGFYIGRYETGDLSKDMPAVKRMNTDIESKTWYTTYNELQYLGANENVKANMIWGCLWDETLQWFIDTEAKIQAEVRSDSSSWGNYKNSTFEYTNISGTTSTKNANSSTKIPTGSTERNKANNIYDMAGNVWDWTLEGNGSYYRSSRGGSCELRRLGQPSK